MKSIKFTVSTLIFIVACPLSWFAAWNSGTWFTVVLSFVMPTYGIFYWGLQNIMGYGFIQGLLSWVFGFVGAFITLTTINSLLKDQ